MSAIFVASSGRQSWINLAHVIYVTDQSSIAVLTNGEHVELEPLWAEPKNCVFVTDNKQLKSLTSVQDVCCTATREISDTLDGISKTLSAYCG